MNNGTRSICPFCGMGCSLILSPGSGDAYVGNQATASLDYDAEGPFNRGSLCAKGNMALELLDSPKRLDAPLVRDNGALRYASWQSALDTLVAGLERIRAEAGGEAIGIVAGPHLSCEEAGLATDLAHALKTPNLDLSGIEDRAMLSGLEHCPATPQRVSGIEQIEAMTATLVVGDLFTVAPCMAKSLLQARYDRRRNLQGVLSASVHRTEWFGKPKLRCRPGEEASALALLLRIALRNDATRQLPWRADADALFERVDLERLELEAGLNLNDATWFIESLQAEEKTGVFLCTGFGGSERPDLVAGLCSLLADATGSRLLAMPNGANAVGVREVLRAAGFPGPQGLTASEMWDAARTGDIKALLVLGSDPLGALPGNLKAQIIARNPLLAVTTSMPSATVEAARVVLPTLFWGEKEGTTRPAFGSEMELKPALRGPGDARADASILADLIERIGPVSMKPTNGERSRTDFFEELEFNYRIDSKRGGTLDAGRHLLLPRLLPFHTDDGWLTGTLSWPLHEYPEATVSLSPAHADSLGVGEGEKVVVRSRGAEAVLPVRVEERVPAGAVMVPPHFEAVRRLYEWRLDPALRDIDLDPCRVSVERAQVEEEGE